MKSEKSKLLLEINGKTVIERSVNAFLSISDIDEIIVVVRECDVEAFSNLLPDSRVSFVIGGDTRQQSVKNAVDTVDDGEFIIIHDGARPLVNPDDIERTLIAAEEYGAAAVGVPVKDTIKQVDSHGIVVSTPDRSSLVAIQTPQIFKIDLYKSALEKAQKEGMDFTDDCQLLNISAKRLKPLSAAMTISKLPHRMIFRLRKACLINS